jgi:hypothetical protein
LSVLYPHSGGDVVSDELPNVHTPDTTAMELARPLPRRFGDTARAIGFAQPAIDYLNATGADDDESDSELTMLPAVLNVGSTLGHALRRAAAFADATPHLNPNSLALARVPGAGEGDWEWHVTLVFAAVDPSTGESVGSTHIGYRQRRP